MRYVDSFVCCYRVAYARQRSTDLTSHQGSYYFAALAEIVSLKSNSGCVFESLRRDLRYVIVCVY